MYYIDGNSILKYYLLSRTARHTNVNIEIQMSCYMFSSIAHYTDDRTVSRSTIHQISGIVQQFSICII